MTEVKGIVSGDHECWCLLVTREDFRRLKGMEPEEFDIGPFAKKDSPYRFKIYPCDIIPVASKTDPVIIRVEADKTGPKEWRPGKKLTK